MGARENIAVFNDTKQTYTEHPVLAAAIVRSAQAQLLIPEDAPLAPIPDRGHAAQVIVSRKRSFEAAQGYPGKKVCLLNFASSTHPGGGVAMGSSAQEESLCRVSTLYPCLNQQEMHDGFYLPHQRSRNPLHNDDCIYTPGVIVFKSDTACPELLPEAQWQTVSVITCAAPNLRRVPGNRMNPGDGSAPASILPQELEALHEKRLCRILNVAAQQGDEVVILGAFGCGAFMNDPQIVSRAMNRALRKYRSAFETIEFAVYSRSGKDANYLAFSEHIQR